MANFGWNDTIAEMNKLNSLNKLLLKLRKLNIENKCVVSLHTSHTTVYIIDLTTEEMIKQFLSLNIKELKMMCIQTSKCVYQINLSKYQTFRFVDNNNSKILHIEFFDNTEVIVNF